MRLQTTLLAAVAAVALSACATTSNTNTADTPDGRDCFRAASANGFSPVDDHHVRVSAGPNQQYIFTTSANSRTFDWSRAIALEGPDWICTGNGLGVSLVGGEPRQRFAVSRIEREPSDAPTGS